MATLKRDGRTLSYVAQGQGTPVVFLHGFTATSLLWQAQVAAFKDRYRVICLDQRGHGSSDSFPSDGYSLDAMAGDVTALLDAEKLSDAVVVGHSMGGMVAQVLAARVPDRLRAVVFSSTTCFGPPRAHFEPIVATAIGLTATTTGDAAADPIMRALKPITEVTARACGEMMMGMGDLSTALVGSPVKTLVIHGDQDSKGIIAAGERLAAILPNATRAVIPGAGHVPQISHVSVYNEVLGRFLDAV